MAIDQKKKKEKRKKKGNKKKKRSIQCSQFFPGSLITGSDCQWTTGARPPLRCLTACRLGPSALEAKRQRG